MTRTFVKGIAVAGAAAGLLIATTGNAFPAGKPKGTPAKPKVVKPVLFINQSVTQAQGLTPKAALRLATKFVRYQVTTPHYLPKNFSLVAVAVFPYIPDNRPLGDTQYFYKAHSRTVTEFEVDHQQGAPFTYHTTSPLGTARVRAYTATVAEQKGTNLSTHKKVDLLYVYWYDSRIKIATEVTADLQSSGLSRSEVLKIANSIS